MSLVRGQVAEDQPVGVAVGTAGQQLGNFRVSSSATGADEMKGPLSRGQRPKTTGNRGGCHSGGIGRGAGGRPAAGILAAGADEMKGPLSPGQRPKITGNRGGCHRIREGQQQQNAEMQEQMVPWGAGEIVSSPQDGLMQDLAQPAQLQGQQCTWEKRQQMVLEDSVEECCGEDSRNGGAAASAAANGRPETQRLPVGAAFGRRKNHVRVARSGGADSSNEESGEDSEGADLDGGTAACAAAIDAVNEELRKLQDRTVELVLERRKLEDIRDAIDAKIAEQQDAVNEDALQQEQDAVDEDALQQEQDAVNEEVGKEKAFLLEHDAATVTVSNLAMEVTEDILRSTFGQFGVVNVKMLQGYHYGGWQSGLVGFQDEIDAEIAEQQFNGVELCARAMLVRVGAWNDLEGEEV
jgi:hypothetical protein